MNQKAAKIYRFVFNMALFTLVLMGVTYYVFITPHTLFRLKDALVPFKGALVLTVVLAVLLAGVNELTTILVVRSVKRNVQVIENKSKEAGKQT